MRSSKSFLVRSVLVGLASLAGPACRADTVWPEAVPGLATRSVTVSWADLDLSKPAGVKELYRRIRVAARVACTALEVERLFEPLFPRSCFDAAVDAAVLKISDERLTALHAVASRRSDHSG